MKTHIENTTHTHTHDDTAEATETVRRAFTDGQDALDFMLSGNATVTFQSGKTGSHLTYKIKQKKDENDDPQPFWFVSVLTGPDNETHYTYCGFLSSFAAFEPQKIVYRGRSAHKTYDGELPDKAHEAFGYCWQSLRYGNLARRCDRVPRRALWTLRAQADPSRFNRKWYRP